MPQPTQSPVRARKAEQATSLAIEWRKLTRAATVLAVLTSPTVFLWFFLHNDWGLIPSLLLTAVVVIMFRGLVDVIVARFIPRPSLYNADADLRDDDVVSRRRLWYWRGRFRRLLYLVVGLGLILVVTNLFLRIAGQPVPLLKSFSALGPIAASLLPQLLVLGLQLPLLFFINFAILFGPLLFFGLKQMKGYEPGDTDWGVHLDDVRGQREPKEEVTRVISLWQAGEEFERAGGKRERGLLFLGAPGTGKTMLSKAIATGFNCPFVTMPGSGFAQTFIGMDVIVVLFLVRKARKLAKKWGGQCIVFIDEIDAVGMRRAALGAGQPAGAMTPNAQPTIHDYCFHGPMGSLTSTGDLIHETREWREKLFAARAPAPMPAYPPALVHMADKFNGFMLPGGMGGGGGGMALNQLLIQMDGVDDPPFLRKFVTNRLNTFLDAIYVVPQKLGRVKLRLRPPKPRPEQIYFIGATNAPIESLDPALTRPGRMGRHIWFRTPSAEDRRDIFDLYLNKVSHDPELDTERRRDELGRITNGYSPAMIEQVCSMGLTYAHSDGRERFTRADLVEAMTTVETGMAQTVDSPPEHLRATALHEAGHAIAAHVYKKHVTSTRLTIRMRGGALGHLAFMDNEDRFGIYWRSEEMASLVTTLAAMATETAIYGENGTGVGGDVNQATTKACMMVGLAAMGPERPDFNGRFATEGEAEAANDMLMARFEKIGNHIVRRAGSGAAYNAEPLVGVLEDRDKRALAAQILGQAFVTAYALVQTNRAQLERIADVLMERRELHGDEVSELLDDVGPVKPEIDFFDERTWPKL